MPPAAAGMPGDPNHDSARDSSDILNDVQTTNNFEDSTAATADDENNSEYDYEIDSDDSGTEPDWEDKWLGDQNSGNSDDVPPVSEPSKKHAKSTPSVKDVYPFFDIIDVAKSDAKRDEKLRTIFEHLKNLPDMNYSAYEIVFIRCKVSGCKSVQVKVIVGEKLKGTCTTGLDDSEAQNNLMKKVQALCEAMSKMGLDNHAKKDIIKVLICDTCEKTLRDDLAAHMHLAKMSNKRLMKEARKSVEEDPKWKGKPRKKGKNGFTRGEKKKHIRETYEKFAAYREQARQLAPQRNRREKRDAQLQMDTKAIQTAEKDGTLHQWFPTPYSKNENTDIVPLDATEASGIAAHTFSTSYSKPEEDVPDDVHDQAPEPIEGVQDHLTQQFPPEAQNTIHTTSNAAPSSDAVISMTGEEAPPDHSINNEDDEAMDATGALDGIHKSIETGVVSTTGQKRGALTSVANKMGNINFASTSQRGDKGKR